MQKKNSIAKNYIYNATYQILTIILPLITTPYVSRVLGAENIGIYSFTLSIATYFILFGSLGLAMYSQREIAYVQDNKKERSKIFYETVILKTITMMISITIYYFIYINGTQYQIYYKVLIIELLATVLDISWFFQGLEEFKKTILRNIFIKLLCISAIFIFIRTKNDLLKYFFIHVLADFLGNISMWLYLPKYICRVKLSELKIFRHIKPTIGLFIPQIAMQIYLLLDKVMLGYLITDKSEVGYYEQSQKIVKMILAVATSLGTVMVPRMAKTFKDGNKEKIQEYMYKSFGFIFLLSIPMMFGIIAVSHHFVPIFFGQGYDKVSTLLIVISPIFLAISMSNVIGTQYLLPTKRQKEFTLSVVLGAITNFCINIILIRKFASVGASIATVIAESMVTIVQMYIIRNDIELKKIFIIMKNYMISGIIMFIVCIIIGIFIHNNIFSIILQVLAGTIVYFSLLYVLKDKMFFYIIDKEKA